MPRIFAFVLVPCLVAAGSLFGFSRENRIWSWKHICGILPCPTFTATVTGSGLPEVLIGNTTVVGISWAEQEFFGGIPFAAPPVGSLRFRPPVSKKSLNVATFNASKFGMACIQPGLSSDAMSEDCLTINILRPAGLSMNAALPVMAWIYGGGFSGGSASSYDGSAIVAQSIARATPIIYVNFNYRLGAFGFPQGREAEIHGALNLGLHDQVMALQWIQDNIGDFGGDKNKVTIFGESAGAVSIGILLLNRGLEMLARAAILQSGGAGTLQIFHPDRNQASWETFVSAIPECGRAAEAFDCLLSVNTSVLLNAFNVAVANSSQQFIWIPVLDGQFLPDLPSRLDHMDHFGRLPIVPGYRTARVPIIVGTNLDEGTMFVPSTISSTEVIRASFITEYTPSPAGAKALAAATDKILHLYPDDPARGSPFNTGNETFGLNSQYKRYSAIFHDTHFEAQRRLLNQQVAGYGGKSFGYSFREPNMGGSLGIAHASEIPFVYGFVGDSSGSKLLSAQIIDYWLSFATSLDPNDGKGTRRLRWEPYTTERQVLIQLKSANLSIVSDDVRSSQIQFLNEDPSLFNR